MGPKITSEHRRTLEGGRLFPAETFANGWSLSIQADKIGYACSPRERYDTIEEYETVEIIIYGPPNYRTRLTDFGLSTELQERFVGHEAENRLYWTAGNVSVALLGEVRAALERISNLQPELTPGQPDLADVAALIDALSQIRDYVGKRRQQPLQGLGNSVHSVHIGTEFEAEITFSALERVADLAAKVAQTMTRSSTV